MRQLLVYVHVGMSVNILCMCESMCACLYRHIKVIQKEKRERIYVLKYPEEYLSKYWQYCLCLVEA